MSSTAAPDVSRRAEFVARSTTQSIGPQLFEQAFKGTGSPRAVRRGLSTGRSIQPSQTIRTIPLVPQRFLDSAAVTPIRQQRPGRPAVGSTSLAYSRRISRSGSEWRYWSSEISRRSVWICSWKRCPIESSISASLTGEFDAVLTRADRRQQPESAIYLLAFAKPTEFLGLQEPGGRSRARRIRHAANEIEYRQAFGSFSSKRSTIHRRFSRTWRRSRER